MILGLWFDPDLPVAPNLSILFTVVGDCKMVYIIMLPSE